MYKKNRPGRLAGRDNDNLFGWTIFIILLAGFALLSWVGSFYIFGHPENAFSYRVLRTLGKIEPPRRFELTAAPRGQFLDADRLFERFGTQTPMQLTTSNQTLLRNYLRNYQHTRDLVPYAIGPYETLAAFRLGSKNFFNEGIVVLARSRENPNVLLEMIFPAEEKSVPLLESVLVTGLDINLARTHDLTAVINARLLTDGRLVLTTVPLPYGSYTSTEAQETFNLEPPASLNVAAGLPVLNQAAVEKADEHHAKHLQRVALSSDVTPPTLMRVQRTEATQPETVPVARAIPVDEASAPSFDDIPVARAIPVDEASIPVARAEPVETPSAPAPLPEIPPVEDDLPPPPPEPEPEPEPEMVAAPAAELEPFVMAEVQETNVEAAPPAPPAGNWTVHNAGQMPRGRLLDVDGARRLAGSGPAETSYLAGDFRVTASSPNRAVLRGRRGGRNVRIIADFPAGLTAPAEGSNFRRDANRPFQITSVEESADGQINIYVREITRP